MICKSEIATFEGKVTEIIHLFVPILLMTFSGSFILFAERIFFAYLSRSAMEVAISVTYICRVFQAPCVSLAMMAQVFVGQMFGAGKKSCIGEYVWQFIWFSILSLLITLPLSIFFGYQYFQNIFTEKDGLLYFYSLSVGNFLYPLGASLSCFYIGRGSTKLVLISTAISHVINIIFSYSLIFGLGGWLPSFGLMGGAFATILAQGSYCLILGIAFLSASNAKQFNTRNYYFNPGLIKNCIRPSLSRALSRTSVFVCWSTLAYLIFDAGDDYIMVWSVGSAIGLFLPFIGDALCQTFTTILSNAIGKSNTALIHKIDQSGVIIILTIAAILLIPIIGFPLPTFKWLFPHVSLPQSAIVKTFLGIWLSFTFCTLGSIPTSRILAFKDAKFMLWLGMCSWITIFGVMYVALKIFNLHAENFWLVLSLSNLVELAFFYLRANWISTKKKGLNDLILRKGDV